MWQVAVVGYNCYGVVYEEIQNEHYKLTTWLL